MTKRRKATMEEILERRNNESILVATCFRAPDKENGDKGDLQTLIMPKYRH